MSTRTKTTPDLAHGFQFISNQSPGETRSKVNRHLVRSHALKATLNAKRRREQARQENFRNIAPQHDGRLTCRRQALDRSGDVPAAISMGRLDPFDSLAADSLRLQTFLACRAVRQAGEPVFTVTQDPCSPSLVQDLRIGLDDPALLNALMLTLAFAANGGEANAECLGYKGKAISHINQKIRFPEVTTTDSTILAILLLAILGLASHVQIHMNGIHKLLQLPESCRSRVGAATRRAIFWQDLNSSVITGSKRLFSHTTFPELAWSRKHFPDSLFTLPPGFTTKHHLLDPSLVEILEDLNSLRSISDSTSPCYRTSETILHLDNQQGWIESRLEEYRRTHSGKNAVLDCLLIVAYLCAYLLYTDIWRNNFIPELCSSHLLQKLQKTSDEQWTGNEDLLLWILCMGGAYASPSVRPRYVELVTCTYHVQLQPLTKTEEWEDVESCLGMFVWSTQTFGPPAGIFWAQVEGAFRKG
ncbi:hypothetical protein V8E51_019455 [Hyaloscypha variabilis]